MKVAITLAVGLVVGGLSLSGEKNDKAKEGLKKLEGTWKVKSAVLMGNSLPQESFKSWSLTLNGNEYLVDVAGAKDKGTVRIDPSKTPPAMDIVGTEGPNKGKTFLAIYELKEDTLKVCYDLEGKKRPKEFESKPQTSHFLAIYERAKKKPADPVR